MDLEKNQVDLYFKIWGSIRLHLWCNYLALLVISKAIKSDVDQFIIQRNMNIDRSFCRHRSRYWEFNEWGYQCLQMLMLVGWNFEWTSPVYTPVSICCFSDALYISDLGYSDTQAENGPPGPCGWGISLLWQNQVGHQYIIIVLYILIRDDDACDHY